MQEHTDIRTIGHPGRALGAIRRADQSRSRAALALILGLILPR